MSYQYPYSIKRHGTRLEKCEHEPVQTPGCVQACGVLLVLRPGDLTILQVSENCLEWLGYTPEDLLAQSVEKAIGVPAAQELRRVLDYERVEKTPFHLLTLPPAATAGAGSISGNSRFLLLSLHVHGGMAFLEIEEAQAPGGAREGLRVTPDYPALVRGTMARFQRAGSTNELCNAIVEEVRRLTELDRVMVYFFHKDLSGEVLAEARRPDQNSWLGWRYPAHDVPQPAREIFKKLWCRPVPDVRGQLYEMVPLLNPDTRQALDMTYCALRGASVMYTEYLDNMGVRAALTMPLIRDGELWGLIACHHNSPATLTFRMRATCDFVARGASQMLGLVEERESTGYRVALEATNQAMISRVALKLDFSAFTRGPVNLISALKCEGAAVLDHDRWSTIGNTPGPRDLETLGHWLLAQPALADGAADPLFVADNLPALYPAAKAFAVHASGVMAFCFSRSPLGLIIYFRPETLQTLKWAGDPSKLPVVQGPHGPRLSPRKSFELWTETVRERSLPWEKVEREAAASLRSQIINVVLAGAEQVNTVLSELESTRATAASEIFKANEKLRMAVEAGDLGTWEYFPTTGEVEWSVRCRQHFGFPPDTRVGYAEFLQTLHPDDRARTDSLVKEALNPLGNGRYDTEYRTAATATRPQRWLRAIGKSLCNEAQGIRMLVGTVQDITELVKARQDLVARRDELQKMVEVQTAELRHTIAELEAFSYSISHDMRSPLRAMQGFSEALLSDYHDRLDEEGMDYLGRINRGARRLDMLIQDVLSYSKVSKSEVVLHAIDLQDFLEEIRRHRPELQEPGATICIPEPLPRVLAHEAFLAQILSNLLENAVKFKRLGIKPIITITAEPAGDTKVRIWVEDNGMGIESHHYQQIFQIFGRVHPAERYEGTGIGLAIVKKAVERMHGEIGLESDITTGSRFWFTLKKAL